jgi:hypothetical protein
VILVMKGVSRRENFPVQFFQEQTKKARGRIGNGAIARHHPNSEGYLVSRSKVGCSQSTTLFRSFYQCYNVVVLYVLF